jgi:hypothetical protein
VHFCKSSNSFGYTRPNTQNSTIPTTIVHNTFFVFQATNAPPTCPAERGASQQKHTFPSKRSSVPAANYLIYWAFKAFHAIS